MNIVEIIGENGSVRRPGRQVIAAISCPPVVYAAGCALAALRAPAAGAQAPAPTDSLEVLHRDGPPRAADPSKIAIGSSGPERPGAIPAARYIESLEACVGEGGPVVLLQTESGYEIIGPYAEALARELCLSLDYVS